MEIIKTKTYHLQEKSPYKNIHEHILNKNKKNILYLQKHRIYINVLNKKKNK